MSNWGTDGIFGTIGKAIKEYNADSVSEADIQAKAVAFVKSYIQRNVAIILQSTQQTFEQNLEWMIDQMEDESQTVDGNAVSIGGFSFVGDATYHLTGDTFTATQMMINNDTIRVECTSASDGADRWTLYSTRRGQIAGYATTDTAYPESDDEDLCGLSFTIEEPESVITGDVGGLLSASSGITGGVKGTNCSAAGLVSCRIDYAAPNYTLSIYKTAANRDAQTNRLAYTTYSTTGSKTLTAENSSGLGGTITVDALGADVNITIQLKIAYSVGDYFLVGPSVVTDSGTIQTFFRDAIERTLPCSLVGTETISDSLAEANPYAS